MEPEQQPPEDYNHPVAYDAEGRPLYAHPPPKQAKAAKKKRASSPKNHDASDIIKLKHGRSVADYPGVSLGDEEYIIAAVFRHSIGLVPPIVFGVFLTSLALAVLFNYDLVAQSLQLTDVLTATSVILLPAIILIGLVAFVTYAMCIVYTNNKLFLTNNNVILKTQTAPFSEREQIVGLANIEDVSYSQNGVLQKLFNYGTIQLTIEGYGTVYKFSYAAQPRKYMVIFDNTIENFQNHHPSRFRR